MRLPALIKPSPRRDWVTPEDVNVSPDLLGHALARPSQRAWAMALDLALIGLASSLGNWMLLGSVAAAAWLKIRQRDAEQAARPAPSVLWWVPVALALVLGLYGVWQDLRPASFREKGPSRAAATAPADDESEDRADAPAAALPEAGAASAASAESRRIADLERRIQQLRRSEEEARKHSGFRPREWLDEALGEAGLRFSLAIVYFTLLPVLWPGQTVGKRLMGLRVAELSGKPINFLRSFSRYGGYLAGMGTGGMGFAQVFWDANRQALQDKAAHTVVLDLRRRDRLPLEDARMQAPAPVPAPAPTPAPATPSTETAP
ncbi:RDD family protein [Pelomonas sp. APW6]|uniref:RDD family protein n=1 Tax=Roseateles subflavus TaxID=3053353 RepID=A0ABT7LFX7_9BURK|nr:RDD family protein [Pelomonas sp. APW6]MDL5031197.1 RDD family protein [Pelomonas sp. APW6]